MSKLLNHKVLPYFYEEEIYIIQEGEGEREPELEQVEELQKNEVSEGHLETNNRVLVVVDDMSAHLDLLEKILAAVSLSLDDVDLVEQEEELDLTHYKKVLLFTGASWNNLEYTPYATSKSNEVQYLSADTLNMISGDVTLKKKLWAELKRSFL